MSRIYKSPPLVEALCEFQFASENWDWTIPGLIYQEIKTRFPQKRQVNRVEFEIASLQGQVSQQVKGNADRMHFLNADNTALVQVGPDLLAVNHLQPYPHWENFRPLISEMFGVYQRIANPKSLKRIGLRFINRIEIPEKSFQISDFFMLEPRLPNEVPHQFKTVFMRVEIPYFTDPGLLILTFGSVDSDQPDKSAFILDLDFATLPDTQLSFDGCENWIESAHTNIETFFEACITEKLRGLFQEVKS
jgi:uncharacterized protein (TIGR04255 family)